MKKLLFIFLISFYGFSQPYISVLGDVRNGTIGSKPTNDKPELDLIIKAGAIQYNGAPIKIGVIYESFNALKLHSYKIEGGYDFKALERIHVIPALEFGWIERYKMNYWTFGGNVEGIYFLNDNLGIVVFYSFNKASDTDALFNEKGNWRHNLSVGLTWRFDKYEARN